jgi:hypothetical protein
MLTVTNFLQDHLKQKVMMQVFSNFQRIVYYEFICRICGSSSIICYEEFYLLGSVM